MKGVHRVAIVGGMRIPFARQNTNYADASNIDMLAAALRGVVDRFGLQGQALGEVVAGAVLKHARDTNISREAALSSGLAAQTPAYDVQQACATSLETAIIVGNKIALGQIEVGIAGGVDRLVDAVIFAGAVDGHIHPAVAGVREDLADGIDGARVDHSIGANSPRQIQTILYLECPAQMRNQWFETSAVSLIKRTVAPSTVDAEIR